MIHSPASLKSRKIVNCIVLILYSSFVLWYTVLGRGLSSESKQLELFWSYRAFFAGDLRLGMQILGNIAFFIPLGYLMSDLVKKENWWLALFLAFLMSGIIELLQAATHRGLFEFDDIFNNTLGALIGIILQAVIDGKRLGTAFEIASVLGIFFLCLVYPPSRYASSNACCFQVDEDLTGFFFLYNQDTPQEYEIILSSTEKRGSVKPQVEYGIKRKDVNDYFSCEYDYSNCGFKLEDLPDTGEYEFVVRCKPLVVIHTDVYVKNGRIYYTKQDSFIPPELDDNFIKNGILRVYRPDQHCWVYQYDGSLYWVVDRQFHFNPSGSTYIQYQLWTTQVDKLPRHRLEHAWYWDNIGGNFEDYQLEGDFGDYRVMKRDLPTEYAIKGILTGYYTNNRWIWKSNFRPIYDL